MEKNNDLNILEERINKLRLYSSSKKRNSNKLDAFGISVEIVAGVIVGLMLGIFLDRVFASKPLFLIICLIIGMISGARTIWLKLKNNRDDA